MERDELINAIEGLLFAAGDPLTLSDMRRIFERALANEPQEARQRSLEDLRSALGAVEDRWRAFGQARGFTLVQVAEGWTFRSNPRYAHVLTALHKERTVRLSKAALETLSIVAYRQPITKPEVDQIRGVDAGATLKLLLDRGHLRIVGKKEEPGRPLLYGTTKAFLSFFNLTKLQDLPTLRDVSDLNDESREALRAFDGAAGLADLSQTGPKLRLDGEAAVDGLEQAMQDLRSTERAAREALGQEGIALDPSDTGDAALGAPPVSVGVVEEVVSQSSSSTVCGVES